MSARRVFGLLGIAAFVWPGIVCVTAVPAVFLWQVALPYAALLSVWASNDLRAAVDYLEGIAGERERDIATLGLLSGMLQSAPDFGGSHADSRATTDIGQDQRWRVREMERLYLSLPVAIRPAPIARWLYGYHRKADPQRAESYQAKGSADTRD